MEKPAAQRSKLISLSLSGLAMNNYKPISLRSRGTRPEHSRRNCIFNNSWAGLNRRASTNVSPFCCRNWRSSCSAWRRATRRWVTPSAIGAIKVSVTSTGGLTGTQTDQLDDLNLNMTSAALPAAWSILICMRSHGGRLPGHSAWPLVTHSVLLNKCSPFTSPPRAVDCINIYTMVKRTWWLNKECI